MFEDERASFKKWLVERQKHFEEINASPADIANIALQFGFTRIVVREWEAHKRWEGMDKSV